MNDIADIRERLASIETMQGSQSRMLERIDGKLDKVDERFRQHELSAAKGGALSGGVVAVAVAYITATLKGGV